MWFRSVFVVMPRVRAISAVLAPVDRARNTSSSRSVSRARRTLEGLPSVRVAGAFGMFLDYFMPHKVLCGSETEKAASTVIRKLAKWLVAKGYDPDAGYRVD